MAGELDHISERAEHLYNRFIRGGGLKTFLKGFYGLLALVVLLVIDLVTHSLKTLQGPTIDLIRAALQGVMLYYWGRALATIYFRHKDLSLRVGKPEASTVPVKGLRWFNYILVVGCIFAFLPNLFTLQLTDYVAKTSSTIVSLTLINAVWIAGASLVIWSFIKMTYLWQHTREVQLRLILWLVPIGLFSIYNYLAHEKYLPGDTIYLIVHLALRSLIIFSTLFLWYRIPWIPHITSTAKNRVILFSITGFVLTAGAFYLYSMDMPDNLLRNYAILIHGTLGGFLLGLGTYFGLVFFNALFTLSSTELVERRQAEVQSLAKLTRFSSDVLTSDLLLDIPRLADQITILAREATQSDAAWLELTMRPIVGASVTEETYRSFDNITAESALAIAGDTYSSASNNSIADELVAKQRAVVVNSREFLPDVEDSTVLKPHSLLAIPLMHKLQMRGTLYVAKEKEYGFDDEDVTVLTAFSDIASLAFDTARLLTDSIEKQKFDGELRAARSMQQSLLPSSENIPKHPEYQIDALSIPAYEVGGDYYDFLTLWDGAQLVITGDVSGKGISASIFMAEVKGIVQALSPQQATVRELLVATNDAVMRNVAKTATSRSFVTLAAVSIKDGYVHYCRAGHTPLLRFSANGEYKYHQPKGMGIGFVKRALFDKVLEEDEFFLAKGECVVLFSDGITEIRNESGEELGYARFAEIVREARSEEDVTSMKDKILKNVLDYSGAMSFFDDATFVIIRRV